MFSYRLGVGHVTSFGEQEYEMDGLRSGDQKVGAVWCFMLFDFNLFQTFEGSNGSSSFR